MPVSCLLIGRTSNRTWPRLWYFVLRPVSAVLCWLTWLAWNGWSWQGQAQGDLRDRDGPCEELCCTEEKSWIELLTDLEVYVLQ